MIATVDYLEIFEMVLSDVLVGSRVGCCMQPSRNK